MIRRKLELDVASIPPALVCPRLALSKRGPPSAVFDGQNETNRPVSLAMGRSLYQTCRPWGPSCALHFAARPFALLCGRTRPSSGRGPGWGWGAVLTLLYDSSVGNVACSRAGRLRSRLHRFAQRPAHQFSSGHDGQAAGLGSLGATRPGKRNRSGHRPSSPRSLRPARVLRPRGDFPPPSVPTRCISCLNIFASFGWEPSCKLEHDEWVFQAVEPPTPPLN